ncbi:MAG: tRNA (adenosine(37)-N6)-threonylcarbamoyltransferase complex ATPase subunit type 1 TsaE [Fimbriimonadaceae bacterium]|jgi:tRNA threonylcarbamoyladenosine biosynthesis protein TsaE|nr:tRNA (adenosine(37)-N6)-threonylcarbamoyltransferase complex ATPase subunit type 1 TsaE [Fimbriimonadaceae bacterium]
MSETFEAQDAEAMVELGQRLVRRFEAGDIVFLIGELGAGKTTLVRGMALGLGIREPVRSPTYTLIQVYESSPPIMHCDLYRLTSASSIGLEDYWENHLCLVEWPERLEGQVSATWLVSIEFEGEGRVIRLSRSPTQGS